MEGHRLLVVEDEQIVATALRKRLQSLGYHVLATTASGEEAVRLASDLRPSLVLMDIQLDGDMDGIEAASHVRRHGIPVVFLTAYSNREVLERAKITEPYGYILKPYEERELHVVVETALYKHRTERALQERERWVTAVLKSIGDGVVATDGAGRITFLNPLAERLTGWQLNEARGKALEEVFNLVNEQTREKVEAPLHKAIRERSSVPMANHTLLIGRHGSEIPIDDCATPILDSSDATLGGVMVFRDVSHRQQAERDRRKLEAQYQQAQKMEAVGRLAGGVAHDFNNLVTIINGYCQVLLALYANEEKLVELVTEIHQAGERAAGLTQQLLAYSRKQILQPTVLTINDVVRNSERMLTRLLGEDVELTTVLAPDLRAVKADRGQLEQVLMNLCVNSRDAMPTGGKITIETQNVHIDESLSAGVFEVNPGEYVLLSVSDTGCGMTQETIAHIFEPFFTTKRVGEGTGLGLATVYGIVKQSEGYVKVYSEPQHGTTFKIYLPSVVEPTSLDQTKIEAPALPRGSETVLLVEDEEGVRTLAQFLLRQCGYQVLSAPNPTEALAIAANEGSDIRLLITDVVMPRMSGPQLAEAMRLTHPNIGVLYLSGYTDDAVFRHGVLASEAAFLQKPFTLLALARKVREVLDVAAGANPPDSPVI